MITIKGTTKLLGVIGNPISHSLSPVMHNAAIADLGVDYVYVAFPIANADLATALAGFAAIGLVGFSVTIPHKQTIIPLLAEVSEEARLVGAVNTVTRTAKGWSGTNTDVLGFIAPLQNMTKDWTQSHPVILGNGGAARAVVCGLARLGCKDIKIVGRDRDRLNEFKQSWQGSHLEDVVEVYHWQELEDLIEDTHLLVNTTPIGMSPRVDECPVEEKLMKKLSQEAIAYDLVYNPRPTKFLRQTNNAIDGLEMLVKQGAAALEIWLGRNVPADVMRQALEAYLK
jgi:shikimate dehydrogenase